MRRADRLLQIIQILRRRGRPTTAMMLAEELEVVPRTIYRDIATLQGNRVPIDGEAGIGYVLRPGYDLPPLMFDADELEAVVLGARMVAERGDPELAKAAIDVIAKVQAVLPEPASSQAWKAALLVPHALEDGVNFGRHVPEVRRAIRGSWKLWISYRNREGQLSERIIWPLGLYLYSHVTIVCAWCETRGAYRAFRSDRIEDCRKREDRFDAQNGRLMQEYLASSSAEGRTST